MRKDRVLIVFMCIVLLFLILPGVNAEEPNVEWTKTFGGSSKDSASSVQQTSDGGYIIAGRTMSFGAGSNDFYLVKLSSEPAIISTPTPTMTSAPTTTAPPTQWTKEVPPIEGRKPLFKISTYDIDTDIGAPGDTVVTNVILEQNNYWPDKASLRISTELVNANILIWIENDWNGRPDSKYPLPEAEFYLPVDGVEKIKVGVTGEIPKSWTANTMNVAMVKPHVSYFGEAPYYQEVQSITIMVTEDGHSGYIGENLPSVTSPPTTLPTTTTAPPTTTPAPIFPSTTIPPTTFPVQTSQTTENRLYIIGGIILLAIFGLMLSRGKGEKIIERERVIMKEIEEILPENCPKCGAPFKGRSGDACDHCGTTIRAKKVVTTIE